MYKASVQCAASLTALHHSSSGWRRIMKILRVVLFAGLLAMTASALQASDFSFGSNARSAAMGGAGLALTDDPSTSSVANPAAPAACGSRFQLVLPSLDFHTRGTTFGELRDSLSDVSGGSDSNAIALAEAFGKAPTTVSVGAIAGFTGQLGFTAEGEAQGNVNPSHAFSEWVNAGMPSTASEWVQAVADGKITDTAILDAYASAIAGGHITNVDSLTGAVVVGTTVGTKILTAIPCDGFRLRLITGQLRKTQV
jgi:hypothetical protein